MIKNHLTNLKKLENTMSIINQDNYNRFESIEALLKVSPIIPSVEILDEFDAVPLVDALEAGGARSIEVNLRTNAAFEAISIIKKRCPQIILGAGNIKTPQLLRQAIDAGAEFGTSPGNTDKLLSAVEEANFPFLPGVNGGSDMMRALEYGHSRQKFCPVASLGGVKALRYFQGPFFEVKFCISGGINDDNIREYLLLSNVECAIGSWIVRAHDIYNKKWDKVTERTKYSFDNVKNVRNDEKHPLDCQDPHCENPHCSQHKAA